MTEQTNKITRKDVSHSIVKGGLGAIPIIGSLAAEIFGLVVTPPLERRRAEWMNDVSEKLKELEIRKIIDFEELQNNEQFIDVVLQATTYALKTSEIEKIEAFRNAILNTATGESPNMTVSQIFLNQLDRFTVWHIKILSFIHSPRQWFKNFDKVPPDYMSGSISLVLEEAYPELKNQDALVEIIWNDLMNAGFHKTSGLKSIMSGNGILSDRTTLLGKEFIAFITKKDE
jgi:hypothetical protein